MTLLGKRGIPVFNYTVEEFEQELDTLDQLQQELEAECSSPSDPTAEQTS